MADQYAVNHKKRHVTVPAKLTDVADQGGRMRVMYDKFTFTSPNLAMAVGDTITLSGASALDADLFASMDGISLSGISTANEEVFTVPSPIDDLTGLNITTEKDDK